MTRRFSSSYSYSLQNVHILLKIKKSLLMQRLFYLQLISADVPLIIKLKGIEEKHSTLLRSAHSPKYYCYLTCMMLVTLILSTTVPSGTMRSLAKLPVSPPAISAVIKSLVCNARLSESYAVIETRYA